MIAIIPLMIAGVALAAYHSVASTATIEIFVDEVSPSADAYAGVAYGDQRESVTSTKTSASLEVSAGQTSTVKVTASYFTDAYNFVGWYAGTLDEYVVALDNEDEVELISGTELSINMSEGGNYVAVYNVVRYTITGWSYAIDPTNEADTTTTVKPTEDAKTEYIYGEELPSVSYNGDAYFYAGWKISGSENGTRYTTATFGSAYVAGGVTLCDPWSSSTPIIITYIGLDGTTITTENTYAGEYHTLTDPSELIADLEGGYEYYWTVGTAGGTAVEYIEEESDVSVYLNRTAITYTATLSYTASDLASEPTLSTTTFTVDDTSSIDEWFSLTTKYTFWDFDGISYNGTTYTSASELVQAIKTTAPASTSIDLEVVITKHLETFYLTYSFAGDYDADYPMYSETVYRKSGSSYIPISSATVTGDPLNSSSEITYCLGMVDEEGNTLDFYVENEDSKYVEVVLKSLEISFTTSREEIIEISSDTGFEGMTLNDILQTVFNEEGEAVFALQNLINTSGTLSITIKANFAPAA